MPEITPNDDYQLIRQMVHAGATDQEIADSQGWKLDELRECFADQLRQARAARRIALRKKQTAIALEGNVGMLIFLGKHELGQDDRINPEDDDPQPQLDPKVG
jgi:hypothetical protein